MRRTTALATFASAVILLMSIPALSQDSIRVGLNWMTTNVHLSNDTLAHFFGSTMGFCIHHAGDSLAGLHRLDSATHAIFIPENGPNSYDPPIKRYGKSECMKYEAVRSPGRSRPILCVRT